MRLLLRGESVIDWHRLDIHDEMEVRRLFRLNGVDIDDAIDRQRVLDIRDRAAEYIREILRLRLSPRVAHELPILQLPILASQASEGSGNVENTQRQACLLLKVMHIIHQLEASELRSRLPVSDNQIFATVEASVTQIIDELRQAGVPVNEFAWSRKEPHSLITKLLIKKETTAARIFDRLRFRLVVANHSDILPTLHIMLRRCMPFNYIVPEQTVNDLVPPPTATSFHCGDAAEPAETEVGLIGPLNEFSAKEFRILNFVADLPVRVDELFETDGEAFDAERGRIIFVIAEFQVMDQATAEANRKGPSSHSAYKSRQHGRVRERLLRMPTTQG